MGIGPTVETGAEGWVGRRFGFALGRGGGGEEICDGRLGVKVRSYAIDVPRVDAEGLRCGLED